MKLYGTRLSHFTRKVRILLAELAVPFEWVVTPSVLAPTADDYGNNPLMRIPTLVDADVTLVDSDHIARYIVAKHDPADRFGVCSADPSALNRLAIVNGVMGNEVVLILAKRGGLEDIEAVAYFRKLRTAIDGGLGWLDQNLGDHAFDYTDMALIAMWQHALHYRFAGEYPRIAAHVAQYTTRASIAHTAIEK